ncbi:MAG: hypothetical protein J6Y71_06865 [Ruminococcus sp.]|nr:hypothetical protein [Ruminococcus sp.]
MADETHRLIYADTAHYMLLEGYDIRDVPTAADVQPLSVVAEHIKNRLYETAFNEPDTVARNAIADMAGRVNFWVNELKDGETE